MNAYLRTKLIIVGGALVINALVTFINHHGCRPFDVRFFVCLAFLNGIFGGLYFLICRLQKKGIKIETDPNSDLNLKSTNRVFIGLLPCPNCKAKTISQINAIRCPQTCGECGNRYQIAKSKDFSLFIVGFYLLTMIGLIYFRDFGSLNPVIARCAVLATLVCFVVHLNVYIVKRSKLEHVGKSQAFIKRAVNE